MIQFYCPNCGEEMEAPDSLGGETLDCPSCSNPVNIPESNDIDLLLAGPPVDMSSHATLNLRYEDMDEAMDEKPKEPKIHFMCKCGIALRVPVHYGGHKARCPGCHKKISVPRSSTRIH